MKNKYSGNIVPIGESMVNPDKIVREGQRAFMKAIVKGLINLEEGCAFSLDEVKEKLAIT